MPLARRQTIALTAAIRERRDQLIEEIRGDAARSRGEPYAAVAGAVHDLADEAVADQIGDLKRAELARDVAELEELEAAARRLADGNYGICIDCKAEIAIERLFARPGVLRCLACQQRFENTHASARGGSL